ncbi:MAG: hypothetical protein JWP91_985 [Fibrobacteres bacterium]|nr:hypothetical protein [Fibrobacterota bacterium]
MVKTNPDSTGLNAGHPSRFRIAGYLAGALDPAQSRETEAHVLVCPGCATLLADARGQAALFADKFPTLESLDASRVHPVPSPRHRTRSEAPNRPGWLERLQDWFDRGFGMRPALAGLALLAAGTMIYLNLPAGNAGGTAASETGSGSEFTAKGSTGFYLFHNGRQVQGDTLACKPSDTLQLGITSAEPVHYALLYRDDDGGLEAYLDGSGMASAPLGKPMGENLPKSLILEAGWKRESLYCLWSVRPFSLDEAKARAAAVHPDLSSKGAGSLHLQTYLLLEKAAP